MSTVSSKVVKNYNKKLLKPLMLQVFKKSAKAKNITLDLPDFSKDQNGESEKMVDEIFEEKENIEEREECGDVEDSKNSENTSTDEIAEDSETIKAKEAIDKDFDSLEHKLKSEESAQYDNLKNESNVDEKNSNEYSLNVGDDRKSHDDKKEEVVPIIEEKKHLEILEAERNKYKKIGYKEGYDKALLDAKERFLKEYEAEKNDYLDSLAFSFSDAISEIKKIRDILLELDKNLPKIVLNFVRKIIGVERKINDKIIISVVKSKIEKLKTLEDIKFYVNHDDVEYLRYEFPGYDIEPDANVKRGSFRVKTRMGEVVFYLDKMVDDLEELIYEELKATESD
jgi:flagellar biosynthesis/type III secretory pathway protein FliH